MGEKCERCDTGWTPPARLVSTRWEKGNGKINPQPSQTYHPHVITEDKTSLWSGWTRVPALSAYLYQFSIYLWELPDFPVVQHPDFIGLP